MRSAPQRSIQEDSSPKALILFRIISRRSWDTLQGMHRALPGSHIEHIKHGIYILVVEPDGALELAG